MRITGLLNRNSISLHEATKSKEDTIRRAVSLMERGGRLKNTQEYTKQVFLREKESTTGVGGGIAIPHAKSDAVAEPGLAAMVIPDGVEFDSLDGEPVTLLFLIAAPDTEDNVHLEVLSRLSVLLMDEDFTKRLRTAADVQEFLDIIDRAELEKFGKNEPKLLAVTACPTGIAHTYMAAEGLQKAAKQAGCSIKIETRGSGGVKNALTRQEIAEADCIIIAADAKVPMERFHGKHVMECPVSDGIYKAGAVIEKACKKEAPVYYFGAGESDAGEPAALQYNAGTERTAASQYDTGTERTAVRGQYAKSGWTHAVYKQLMNGVSHMLPFVVGGGILIALAFLIDGQAVDLSALSQEEREAFGSITAAAAFVKSIGSLAFGLMLPILAGFIAEAIGDRPALAPGFVGGLMAANHTSGFLGALVAGFFAGYMTVVLRKLFQRLPGTLEGLAPVLLYPLLGISLMGIGMSAVIEPVVGAVNLALNEGLGSMGNGSRLLLGFVLAAMMAVDMGGPCNKAAYVFGTAAIVSGNYDIMAAVMIGGMVPPCAIALSTVLFRHKYTRQERQSGPANFIMGLAFITEGAIPFAAADPLRVLPACMIGAGVSGMLSELFHCTLMAPHGGIFVFPVVGNAIRYLLALIIGTAISAILLGVFKRTVSEGEQEYAG